MIFVFSAKPQPNQKNMAMRHSDTLKIEAWSAQNNLPGHQNDSLRVQDEAQEWQDRPWDCPNACQDRPWQPNLLLEVLPNANFGVLGASGIDFGGPKNPIWEDPASILNQKFHSIPCYINHRAWHYRHCGALFFLRLFASLYVVVLLLFHEDLDDTGVSDNIPTEAVKRCPSGDEHVPSG